MAAELGHMIMEIDGRLHAGTGVKGVFEAYGSATGVRERAKDALKKEVRRASVAKDAAAIVDKQFRVVSSKT